MAQVKTCWQAWSEAVEQKDLKVWTDVCPIADDMVQWDTSEGSPNVGLEIFEKWVANNIARMYGRQILSQPRPLSIKIINDMALVYSYGVGIVESPEGKPVNWESKLLDVWHKKDGKWTYIGGMAHPVPKQ